MRLPNWLQKRSHLSHQVHDVKKNLRRAGLHTVCEEARCPNQGECFARGTATFMIMGDVCTRHCGFCAVKSGAPAPLDTDEPMRVSRQVREMKLTHAVITSVTRDDLEDGGASHFARTIEEIKRLCPEATIEVLTPDFGRMEADIKTVCDAKPDIFNHNVETVERLTPLVRSRASYRRSLEVLKTARHIMIPPLCKGREGGVDLPPLSPPYKGGGLVKSGLMVGLGETEDEVAATLHDLKKAGCDIVTIGQYLQPTKESLPVKEYIHPDRFKKYQLIGEELGIKHMFCGPFVRSSYMAERGLYGS